MNFEALKPYRMSELERTVGVRCGGHAPYFTNEETESLSTLECVYVWRVHDLFSKYNICLSEYLVL